MKPPQLLEKHVIEQARDYLHSRGWRLVKTQVVAGPGYSVGEPGCADYLCLHYQPNGVALALWLEFKGPNDKRRCTCTPLEKKVCKLCRQKKWHARERGRGAVVWVVSELMAFIEQYEREYSWLHSGDSARGQLDLLAGART
jgi:hypothetical protein